MCACCRLLTRFYLAVSSLGWFLFLWRAPAATPLDGLIAVCVCWHRERRSFCAYRVLSLQVRALFVDVIQSVSKPFAPIWCSDCAFAKIGEKIHAPHYLSTLFVLLRVALLLGLWWSFDEERVAKSTVGKNRAVQNFKLDMLWHSLKYIWRIK